jgi:hypothetical protein
MMSCLCLASRSNAASDSRGSITGEEVKKVLEQQGWVLWGLTPEKDGILYNVKGVRRSQGLVLVPIMIIHTGKKIPNVFSTVGIYAIKCKANKMSLTSVTRYDSNIKPVVTEDQDGWRDNFESIETTSLFLMDVKKLVCK